MGARFAVLLGSLAMTAVIVRGVRYGGGVEATLLAGTASLAVFAAVGYVLGALAQWTVEDAVRRKQITFHESAEFLRRYERGLKGYTYLEG